MNIIPFKNINFNLLYEKDETERDIGYSIFDSVVLTGRNIYYPNVLLYSDNTLISPYDEKIMSLNKDSFYDNNKYELNTQNKSIYFNSNSNSNSNLIIENPVFFFIYNFDNYYHFLYDTLPYLFTYLELKKTIPELKLLVNYPNKDKKDFYRFNTELLTKIIDLNDIIIDQENNVYNKVYVSTSLTHGGFSNNAPRKEIYTIYNIIKNNINYENINKKYSNLPINIKIYISRRTWINNDKSNIGTDYTTRRKMMNEDQLVEKLMNIGFQEIFAENLNTDEKIYLFSNADTIVGSIGGGMANLLFSNNNTKSIVIATPFFLDINYRFKYSMEHTDIQYIYDVKTYLEDNKIPLYCRVKISDSSSEYFEKYGEICEYNNENNQYLVNISNNDVAGFNNNIQFKNNWFHESEFILLDNGLNSPYNVDINKLLIRLF
jgi:hypothetical protein